MLSRAPRQTEGAQGWEGKSSNSPRWAMGLQGAWSKCEDGHETPLEAGQEPTIVGLQVRDGGGLEEPDMVLPFPHPQRRIGARRPGAPDDNDRDTGPSCPPRCPHTGASSKF